jgi:serine/threonine-protein kinase
MVLADKYRLESEIGRGGMGSVWRAKRLDLDADVAVKVLHVEVSQRADLLSRFSREAKATASLSSPHVIRIIDFGVDSVSEHAFLVMELLLGQSLRERLNRSRPLTAQLVVRVLTQVGRALNQAHSLGIVHRDLKPGNIFLVQNGDEELVKLLDFGIAKTEEAPDEVLLTQTGNVLGTPQYMSPEQLNSSRTVDHRSDLWSLAVIAYECLVGRRPFRGASVAELAMKVSLGRCEPASSLGPVPAGFDAWFARATEVDPERRFQSANELTQSLQLLAAEPWPAQHAGHTRRAPSEPLVMPAAESAAAVALEPTLGEPPELLHVEAASIASNTNSAVTSPLAAAVVAIPRRGPWSLGAFAAAVAVVGGVAAVGGGTWLRSGSQDKGEASAPAAAVVVEASQPLRAAESQVGGRPPASDRVGDLPSATLMALPAPTAALIVAPVEQVEPVAAPPASGEGSRSRRARARGKTAAARARAQGQGVDVSSAEGTAPSKRHSSRVKGVPAATKAATTPNRLDAYDWQ